MLWDKNLGLAHLYISKSVALTLPGFVSRVLSLASFFTLTCLGRSPAILGSPRRTMWGQLWKVLMKNGLVTPRMTLGLRASEAGRRTDRGADERHTKRRK